MQLLTKLANSSGYPSLFNAESAIRHFLVSVGMTEAIGVSIVPGAIESTLMPYLPRSLAMGRTMALIDPLVEE